MSRWQANLLLLVSAAIWGGGFVAQSTALRAIGPFWFIGLRFAVATACALPFAVLEGRRAPGALTRRHIGSFLLIGLALFLGAATQQVGLLYTTVTNSSFLTGLYVVFVPLIARFVLGRRPHWIIWPATLLAFLGIFLLSGGSIDRLNTGDLLTIVCALFWAVQLTLVGLFVGESGRPLALSTVQFAVSAVGGLAVAVLREPVSLAAISAALGEILYVGMFSSGLGFVLQVIAQRHTTAPQAAIFLSAEALFGAFFGALLLGETLGPSGYWGCAIIFAAMILVETVPDFLRFRSARTAPEQAIAEVGKSTPRS